MASNEMPGCFYGKEGDANTSDDFRRPAPTEQDGRDAVSDRAGGVLQSMIGDLDMSWKDRWSAPLDRP